MSGAEVAGFVLAVLPLFISTLEHYNNGLEPIKSFFQWKSQLPGFIRGLRTQRVHLEQNLKVLLSPLLSLDEITTMMADGTSELWKGGISDKLQERLGEAFDEYRRTFLDCEETLKSLILRFDINDNGKVSFQYTALIEEYIRSALLTYV